MSASIDTARSCTYLRWVRDLWWKRKVEAKHAYRTIPPTDNWTRSMKLAQRVFPGTYSWLEFISNRECRACYTVPGAFVCNTQGSGACGPMQFMAGTFYGHVGAARLATRARGFIVDPHTWDWHNPLGQALTAAHMRFIGADACHWCLY